ncbi:MAG: SIS domain-containing protein [Chloroflexota bacterium]|nr:SIS domain-containing protein [Chloroflexota bacterium]
MPSTDARTLPGSEPRDAVQPYELDAVQKQADLIRQVVGRVRPQVEQVITPELAASTSRVFITGCGDSYYAALASRLFFDRYAGVSTEPLEALEFSRYVVDYMPPASLTIAISNSGLVSRTIETLVRARGRGSRTIAVTGREGSPLAQAAESMVLQTVPEMAGEARGPFAGLPYGSGALGLGNFIASLTTLYLCALRFGELRGTIDRAHRDALEQELVGLGGVLQATARANEPVARLLAERFRDLSTFYILGAGPNHATAQFAAAKLFEQPHLQGIPQQLEEWAHEQIFLTRHGVTPIFVLAPEGRAHDRALEQLRGAREIGATVIGVASSADEAVTEVADVVMPIVGGISEEYSPLAYIVPGMLFATAMHQLRGRPAFTGGYTEEKLLEVNSRLIFHSRVRDH